MKAPDRVSAAARGVAAVACAVLVAAPALAEPNAAAPCRSRPLAFDAPDAGWKHVPMSKSKRDTAYTIEREGDRTLLVARAESSASFYVASFDRPMQVPETLDWAWKTDALVPGADNRERRREDAPLRVIVAFDGDPDSLPAGERSKRKLAESMAGRAPPFAAIMYIWSDQVAPETIIPSSHTSQIKMVVVSSGSRGLGSWQALRRNLAADYRRAYGSEPGPLLGVAVLTDTDNTGATATGRYADFRLKCAGD